MKTDLFDYDLPPELIAQQPVHPRDASRLLVLDRDGRPSMEHRLFRDLTEYLGQGDLLVLNETRVMRARLVGRRHPSGGKAEVLLLRRVDGDEPIWEALVRPGRRLRPGAVIGFGGEPGRPELMGRIVGETAGGGRIIVFEPASPDTGVSEAVERLGRVPLPPYISRDLEDDERYQTVYAAVPGSSAAPTAGLHFTEGLLERLKAQGVKTAFVTLNIGPATFRPVQEEEVERHRMHREWYEVPPAAARAVNDCRLAGGRVVACGTTVVRALESAAAGSDGLWEVVAGAGDTVLFIYPGYEFRVVDVILTNFHLPRSTLLMLVSAFAGTGRVRAAYEEARSRGYRFYSFGDAMLLYRGDGR